MNRVHLTTLLLNQYCSNLFKFLSYFKNYVLSLFNHQLNWVWKSFNRLNMSQTRVIFFTCSSWDNFSLVFPWSWNLPIQSLILCLPHIGTWTDWRLQWFRALWFFLVFYFIFYFINIYNLYIDGVINVYMMWIDKIEYKMKHCIQ